LGKSTLNATQAKLLNNAAKKEADLVKQMEGIVNTIIDAVLKETAPPAGANLYTIGAKMAASSLPNTANTAALNTSVQFSNQKVASCFRCSQVGAISTIRLKTNTYVPSFNINPTWLDELGLPVLKLALRVVANSANPRAANLVDNVTGDVLIYKTVYDLMAADYDKLSTFGLYYMTAAIKPRMTTLVGTNNATYDPKFLKVNSAGVNDAGKSAALEFYKWYDAQLLANKVPGTKYAPINFTRAAQRSSPTGRRLLQIDDNPPVSEFTDYKSLCAQPDYTKMVVPLSEEDAKNLNRLNPENFTCTIYAADPGGMGNDGACDKLESANTGPVACNSSTLNPMTGMLQLFCNNGKPTAYEVGAASAAACSSNNPDDGGALTMAAQAQIASELTSDITSGASVSAASALLLGALVLLKQA